ncbi:hypothetical protein FDF74_03205 [Clostridium niameyense]|uniref:DUF5673 domain-containing protein n=1 Tax=Clostridium niameyense TaxID=1622073 RepID=A0A6M0RAH1_9CLOT|nr:hypothetical protein [Clostridium niameyense]NEZ46218.1 hypothetical protein [Clostridium niameyense]
MSFDKIFQIVLIVAIVLQFYYSFIKGRESSVDVGKDILFLKRSSKKQSFILLIMILIIGYMMYAIIKSNVSNMGLLIVIYLILFIYDFSKIKIVTDKGIGNKSLYTKSIYNFANWEDIVKWEWHPKQSNILFFNVKIKEKEDRRDWDIYPSDREKMNSILQKYAGSAFVESKEIECDEKADNN